MQEAWKPSWDVGVNVTLVAVRRRPRARGDGRGRGESARRRGAAAGFRSDVDVEVRQRDGRSRLGGSGDRGGRVGRAQRRPKRAACSPSDSAPAWRRTPMCSTRRPRCCRPSSTARARSRNAAAGRARGSTGHWDDDGPTTRLLVRDLTRRFGAFTAVDRISFAVERGEIFGFLGANGAGKSTDHPHAVRAAEADVGNRDRRRRRREPRSRRRSSAASATCRRSSRSTRR